MKKILVVAFLLPFLLLPSNIFANESNDFSPLTKAQKEWIEENYSSFGENALLIYCQWSTSSHNGNLIYKSSYTGGTIGAVVEIYPDGTIISSSVAWDESRLEYSYIPTYIINTSSNQYNAFECSSGQSFNFDIFACEVPEPTQTYTITTAVSPSGSGTVTGGGTYEEGTNVTLTATANSGYQFVSWSNGSTDRSINVTVNNDVTYTAFFELIPTYTITTAVSPSGSGSVTGGGTYEEGTNVTLTATANSGYQFVSWSNGSTQSSINVSVNSNETYTAYFELINDPNPPDTPTYTITTAVSPSGSGTVTGGGTYEEGTNVTLTATANSGYQFVSWSNGSSTNTINVTANNNETYTAYFELIDDPNLPEPPTDENLILQHITYTNPIIAYKYVNNEPTLIYMYYDVTVSYYGVGLDVYYSNGEQSTMIQSNINKFTYTYTDYKWQTCCNIPVLPSNKYTLATSFAFEEYTILPTSDTGVIEVINPSVNDLINNGNEDSQNAVNNNNSQNESLNDSINAYDQLEQGFKNDLDYNLGNLDLDFKFSNITDFTKTASFVRTQFDNLTGDNPFGLLLGFSLAVGISLLIIGKRL